MVTSSRSMKVATQTATSVHHFGIAPTIRRPLPHLAFPDMVVSRHVEEMERDLRELVATVQDPHLRGLLDALLGPDAPTWPRYRDAPAAKRLHQAYQHGLLE